MSDFKPSEYQQAIFDFIENDKGSTIVEAVAGSGKTTTILKSLDLIDSRNSVLFLAFNKKIQKELESRVPSYVKAKTFHALGLGAWLKTLDYRPNLNDYIDKNKSRTILRSLAERRFDTYEDRRAYVTTFGSFCCKLVGLAKNAGIGYLIADTPSAWQTLIDHFDLMLDDASADENVAIELAREMLSESNKRADEFIDFDDMLYLPLIHNLTFWQNDFVFVDEAQDTNGIQLALLKRMLRPRGRLIAVGDSAQAIYGFRGASSDALDIIASEFNCSRLPLSVSYRCPRAVVELAATIEPRIESFDGAKQGSIVRLGTNFALSVFAQTDVILCRNTAPLVDLAFRCIRNGIACEILGRDIGTGLIKLIERQKAKGIDRLIEKLGNYSDREIAKFTSKGQEGKAQAIADRIETIFCIIDGLDENERTIPALLDSIDSLFSDKVNGVLTLSTVHKSKGAEYPRVFLLNAEQLMPSSYARKDWQLKQENNLIYVAYTRAQESLIFIETETGGR